MRSAPWSRLVASPTWSSASTSSWRKQRSSGACTVMGGAQIAGSKAEVRVDFNVVALRIAYSMLLFARSCAHCSGAIWICHRRNCDGNWMLCFAWKSTTSMSYGDVCWARMHCTVSTTASGMAPSLLRRSRGLSCSICARAGLLQFQCETRDMVSRMPSCACSSCNWGLLRKRGWVMPGFAVRPRETADAKGASWENNKHMRGARVAWRRGHGSYCSLRRAPCSSAAMGSGV